MTTPQPVGLLLATMEPPAGLEEEFQDWYDSEHFPERQGCPGFLTAPATPRTAGMVSAAVLAAMRPDAWLLNVGRGSLVDQVALAAALDAGRLGGAILDVTTPEPLPPDDPLWQARNLLVTPHVSGTGDLVELWHQSALLLAEQLRRDLAGERKLNITSGAAGY